MWFALKRRKKRFYKLVEKNSCSSRIYCFSPDSRVFFSDDLGIRFRLADSGGVEPLRKLFRQNLDVGTALEHQARPGPRGYRQGRMYTRCKCLTVPKTDQCARKVNTQHNLYLKALREVTSQGREACEYRWCIDKDGDKKWKRL